jgi:hypothetical protein
MYRVTITIEVDERQYDIDTASEVVDLVERMLDGEADFVKSAIIECGGKVWHYDRKY